MGNQRTALIIGGLVVGAIAIIFAWASMSEDAAPVLTEITEPSAIQSAVQLTDTAILTSENYVGHRLRVIRGWLKNVSDKPIRLVEVKFAFTDYNGKTVQESVHRAFEPTQKPIDPGAAYRFEVSFENLPRTWNYRVPVTQVVKLGY